MSSKFSMTARTPKEPHVCRKPPPGAEFKDPHFPDQVYQGFVEWKQPLPYIWGTYTFNFTMTPGPTPTNWSASVKIDDHTFLITMQWPVESGPITHTIRHFIAGTPFELHTVTALPPRSRHPFDSDHIQADPPPTNGYLRWHIWA